MGQLQQFVVIYIHDIFLRKDLKEISLRQFLPGRRPISFIECSSPLVVTSLRSVLAEALSISVVEASIVSLVVASSVVGLTVAFSIVSLVEPSPVALVLVVWSELVLGLIELPLPLIGLFILRLFAHHIVDGPLIIGRILLPI